MHGESQNALPFQETFRKMEDEGEEFETVVINSTLKKRAQECYRGQASGSAGDRHSGKTFH